MGVWQSGNRIATECVNLKKKKKEKCVNIVFGLQGGLEHLQQQKKTFAYEEEDDDGISSGMCGYYVDIVKVIGAKR